MRLIREEHEGFGAVYIWSLSARPPSDQLPWPTLSPPPLASCPTLTLLHPPHPHPMCERGARLELCCINLRGAAKYMSTSFLWFQTTVRIVYESLTENKTWNHETCSFRFHLSLWTVLTEEGSFFFLFFFLRVQLFTLSSRGLREVICWWLCRC